jgi:hypothetical protein
MNGRVVAGSTGMRSASASVAAMVLAAAAIIVSLAIANYVGWLRLKPEVSAVSWINDIPHYEAHLLNIHERATARANGSLDSFLPIYDVQNPGFFLLVAELYVRAGATTPFALEITSMALFNIAAVCFFFWVYFLFSDLTVAVVGTIALTLSKFFLFYPGMTHTFPYEFFFFNLTMLFFVLFLKSDRKIYLVASLVAMFMTCMNYWFYYTSSWIIVVGLWWQYKGRPGLKELALLSTPAIAAAAFTAAMVMALFGGVSKGFHRLADIFVARTFDARIEGANWYPDRRFMGPLDWIAYPRTVVERLEWAFSLEFFWFALAAVYALFFLSLHNRKSFVSALILLLGGFSWYFTMFQHTHIHYFVGQYSFMAICPLFGLIVSEAFFLARRSLHRATEVKRGKSLTADFAMAALLLGLVLATIWPFVGNTYRLINQTADTARTVQVKYAQAVQAICQNHSKVTLESLEEASRDWGFKWLPHLIVGTNRTPECPGKGA